MRKLYLLGILLSATAMAASYPVDEEVAKLRAKADYLDQLKNTLLSNQCYIQVDKNKVLLTAGALRSQGLVMTIGPNFPGQYLANHQAPKPEFLANTAQFSFPSIANAGKNVAVVSAGLDASPGATAVDTFVVSLNNPVLIKDTEGLWWYAKRSLRMKIPTPGSHSEVSATGPAKENVTVGCN